MITTSYTYRKNLKVIVLLDARLNFVRIVLNVV